MKIEQPVNPNYAATVVTLRDFVDLPGCDRIKGALAFGTQVIVGRDVQPGDKGLYFPVECALSTEFAGANNLFCKAEYGNADKAKKGFFEKHGRVKCVKFRGNRSEGFWIPIGCMSVVLGEPVYFDTFKDGDTFDKVGDFPICQKYVSRKRQGRGFVGQEKTAKPEDRIVEGQFRFHPDTQQLRRNLDLLRPDSVISISDKWHGTSVVIGKLLSKRSLPWYERIAKRLGIKVQESEYTIVTSSRKVIKSIGGKSRPTVSHFYDSDVWTYWSDRIKDKIPSGYTAYAEIVGYTLTGSPIQGGYSYGCTQYLGPMFADTPSTSRLVIYRVTFTNQEGLVFELPWLQMRGWCYLRGLETVPELYYGLAGKVAGDLVPYLEGEDLRDWRDAVLKHLETVYAHDQDCEYNPGMPAEGIVLRIDHSDGTCTALKLKNYRFLLRESELLDQGVEDIEELESTLGSEESREKETQYDKDTQE